MRLGSGPLDVGFVEFRSVVEIGFLKISWSHSKKKMIPADGKGAGPDHLAGVEGGIIVAVEDGR